MLDSHVFHHNQLDDEDGPVSIEDTGEADEASVLYCERFMEFLIDLLSQLPTRRYASAGCLIKILILKVLTIFKRIHHVFLHIA